MGLLDAAIQYIRDALPGGLLNAEIPPYLDKVGRNIVAGHKSRDAAMKGLLADPMNSELQGQVVRNGLDLASIAPLGMIAYHGSPHKFDKFSLDKIGTGEGVQAYGHGLYLAENPGVANSYRTAGIFDDTLPDGGYSRLQALLAKYMPKLNEAMADDYLWKFREGTGMANDTTPLEIAYRHVVHGAREPSLGFDKATKKAIEIIKSDPPTHLYKTDIPDESVARFLDWDKPLSQQAPEVQAALQRAVELSARQTGGAFGALDMSSRGADVVPTLGEGRLRQSGIPGIRYLDGGSRSAGQGSSNFVVFDPEMIRILERNGVPTGQKPWSPGEFQGLLAP